MPELVIVSLLPIIAKKPVPESIDMVVISSQKNL